MKKDFFASKLGVMVCFLSKKPIFSNLIDFLAFLIRVQIPTAGIAVQVRLGKPWLLLQ